MTLIGVEWLWQVAVTFSFFALIWGPPKIILPRAPQSVRPGLLGRLTLWINRRTYVDTRSSFCKVLYFDTGMTL